MTSRKLRNRNVSIGATVIALALALGLGSVLPAFAEGPPCGWNDDCTDPESVGVFVPYSCNVGGAGSRCRIIKRALIDCGNHAGWAYKYDGTGGAVPCSEDCEANAACEPPQGGGGGG